MSTAPTTHRIRDREGERRMSERELKCPGVGRDKDCISALQFYFSRRVTDDEMRFLHEVVQRSVALMPTRKVWEDPPW